MDNERVALLVIVGAQRRQPLIAHQHQETLLGKIGGGGGIEAARAIFDRVEPVGGQGLPDGEPGLRQGLG